MISKSYLLLVDQLTPGYYCTLPRNIARRQKPSGSSSSGVIGDNGMLLMSRNPSLDGSMNEVSIRKIQGVLEFGLKMLTKLVLFFPLL